MKKQPAEVKKLSAAVALLAAVAVLAGPARAQDAEGAGIRVRPGLGIEHFSRTVSWDEAASTSKLVVSLAVLRAEVELATAGRLALFAGYSLSNFNGLTFRQLPFSLEYQAGTIGSLLWGADFEGRVAGFGDIEVGVAAQFAMSLGRAKEFEAPSLNAAGTVDGKGTWSRILAGPLVRYAGYENFTPYLSVSYNRLWGTFTMSESIGALSGVEEKKITGRGSVGFAFGAVFEPSASVKVQGELTAVPYKKLSGGLDTDYGVAIKAVISI